MFLDMTSYVFLLSFPLALLAASLFASADVEEYTFNVENFEIERLCNQLTITGVNGVFPGPTIAVHEGDTIIVHVFNKSPYPITVHWHGIFQKLTAWADGADSVTQCPIQPGSFYTYKFQIVDQEGTLWWHAHSTTLRATVHGALIIKPRKGHSYPFRTPFAEYPILLGEWYNANVVDVEKEALASGGAPNASDAYTINGLPGDSYQCSQNQMFNIKLIKGKTYMLRLINTALNSKFFFKIANHKMTVVAIDASYTKPYLTEVVFVAPGQTTDVLLNADQPVASYYMVASPYTSAPGSFDSNTTRGLVVYEGSKSTSPISPTMPLSNDTDTAFRFTTGLRALVKAPHWVAVPSRVDVTMFVTMGLGVVPCGGGSSGCLGPLGERSAGSMNNVSLQLPSGNSMLQAFYSGLSGVYTTDFPDNPPVTFDYTNTDLSLDSSLVYTEKATRAKLFKYNSVVEIILQNTALVNIESHPMHIHAFNFHILAQGFGNYNPTTDRKKFNLIDAQIRNTIEVPVGGWAAIRFVADNPGVWIMHCHMDEHVSQGLGMVFVVENGRTKGTKLPPPPADLPRC